MRTILITLLVLTLAVPVFADEWTKINAKVDAIDNYVDTEVGAIRDSLEDANDFLQALRGPAAGTLHTVDLAGGLVGRHTILSVTGSGTVWFLPVDSVAVAPANATDSIMVMTSGGATTSDSVLIACDADTWDAGEPLGCGNSSGQLLTAAHYIIAPAVATGSAPHGFPWKVNVHTANYGATAAPLIIGIEVIGGTVTSGTMNFIYWSTGNVTVTATPWTDAVDW